MKRPRTTNNRTSDPGDGVKALRQAVALSGKSRQSPLYRWMLARQPAFAAFLAEERPTWQAVVEGLAAQGFTAEDGTPLNPVTVRSIWWRVRQHAKAARERGEAKPRQPLAAAVIHLVAPTPAIAAPASRSSVLPRPAFDPLEGGDEGRPPPRFGTTKIPE